MYRPYLIIDELPTGELKLTLTSSGLRLFNRLASKSEHEPDDLTDWSVSADLMTLLKETGYTFLFHSELPGASGSEKDGPYYVKNEDGKIWLLCDIAGENEIDTLSTLSLEYSIILPPQSVKVN